MRIHLGHHFYGAGNLGDDFMLAGFFAAMRLIAPHASFSCAVPFALDPLRARFPQVEWLPCDAPARAQAIGACDAWLGLGGSPFQHALSRWFLDHLVEETTVCERARKPMFFLGIGVQNRAELAAREVRHIAARAAGIWTRDPASAELLNSLPAPPPVEAAADLAHLFFRENPPPPAAPGRVSLVANFDYAGWPGRAPALRALDALGPRERIWLAQESRDLPGAERALFAELPAPEQHRWQLVAPDLPGRPLGRAFERWPSGEWLLTARYHAALAGAWAHSKIVVIAINEKLRAAARELHCPTISPDCDEAAVGRALAQAAPAPPPHAQADRAFAACQAFVAEAARHAAHSPARG